MNIATMIDDVSKIENVGGQFYMIFPYVSSIGLVTEPLSVQVPIAHDPPTANDKKALLEAVTVQGGIGRWIQKDDGSVWLMPAE